MKQGFRQSMAWLHTWTGLLVGWVLLLIFMGGTASYYRDELSRWMRPELPTTTVSSAVAMRSAERYLQTHAPDAQSWNITLPDARTPVVTMYWQNPAPPPGKTLSRRELYGNAIIDPATGNPISARDTLGGDFFYRLHFDLHYLPVVWARYIVGFCAMFMLVAIISGVITHKKIFKDFFTFRPGKGLRSWLDFHNVSAVTALPYHAMITYTGIVTLMFMYLPWGIKAQYPTTKCGSTKSPPIASRTRAPRQARRRACGRWRSLWRARAATGVATMLARWRYRCPTMRMRRWA